MTDALAELGAYIRERRDDAVLEMRLVRGELSFDVSPARLLALAGFLRDGPKCAFATLIDICGVDFPGREKRFDVVYHFLSMRNNHRVRLHVGVREGEGLPSLCPLYPCAEWFEREVFDMFGVPFNDHPDLRRILTDYGFQGHPLRKDFPMTGHVEVRYDEEAKRVAYGPVNLAQEYRRFAFESPWQGARHAHRMTRGDAAETAGEGDG